MPQGKRTESKISPSCLACVPPSVLAHRQTWWLVSHPCRAGAGRVVYQDICTIDNSIEDGSLPTQEALVAHIDALQKSGGTSHVMGLVSPGGVHAHQVAAARITKSAAAAAAPRLQLTATSAENAVTMPPPPVCRTRSLHWRMKWRPLGSQLSSTPTRMGATLHQATLRCGSNL